MIEAVLIDLLNSTAVVSEPMASMVLVGQPARRNDVSSGLQSHAAVSYTSSSSVFEISFNLSSNEHSSAQYSLQRLATVLATGELELQIRTRARSSASNSSVIANSVNPSEQLQFVVVCGGQDDISCFPFVSNPSTLRGDAFCTPRNSNWDRIYGFSGRIVGYACWLSVLIALWLLLCLAAGVHGLRMVRYARSEYCKSTTLLAGHGIDSGDVEAANTEVAIPNRMRGSGHMGPRVNKAWLLYMLSFEFLCLLHCASLSVLLAQPVRYRLPGYSCTEFAVYYFYQSPSSSIKFSSFEASAVTADLDATAFYNSSYIVLSAFQRLLWCSCGKWNAQYCYV
jgi:hypothetical protein